MKNGGFHTCNEAFSARGVGDTSLVKNISLDNGFSLTSSLDRQLDTDMYHDIFGCWADAQHSEHTPNVN